MEIPEEIDNYMRQVNDLAGEILDLSAKGEELAENESQHLFFTVVRDCAFKIKQEFKRVKGDFLSR